MTANKKTASKPKQAVKCPDTIYVIIDVFLDFDFRKEEIVGFTYSKEGADEFMQGHQEEMEKGAAMFGFYEDRYFNAENDESIEKYQNLADNYSQYEHFHETIVEEAKQIKKVK